MHKFDNGLSRVAVRLHNEWALKLGIINRSPVAGPAKIGSEKKIFLQAMFHYSLRSTLATLATKRRGTASVRLH
jgi:hypothetical protein